MSTVILKLSLSVHSSKIKYFLQIGNCPYLVRTQKPLSAPTLIAGKATTADQGSCNFAMISGCLSNCRVALFVKRLVVYIFRLVQFTLYFFLPNASDFKRK